MKIFCNIIKAVTVTCDPFKSSLLKSRLLIFFTKSIDSKFLNRSVFLFNWMICYFVYVAATYCENYTRLKF